MAAAAPGRLDDGARSEGTASMPQGHPWAEKLAGRPGLTRLVKVLAGRIHEARVGCLDTDKLSAELRQLVDEDFGLPEELEGASRLLASPPRDGHRFAVGFAPSPFSFMGRSLF